MCAHADAHTRERDKQIERNRERDRETDRERQGERDRHREKRLDGNKIWSHTWVRGTHTSRSYVHTLNYTQEVYTRPTWAVGVVVAAACPMLVGALARASRACDIGPPRQWGIRGMERERRERQGREMNREADTQRQREGEKEKEERQTERPGQNGREMRWVIEEGRKGNGNTHGRHKKEAQRETTVPHSLVFLCVSLSQ